DRLLRGAAEARCAGRDPPRGGGGAARARGGGPGAADRSPPTGGASVRVLYALICEEAAAREDGRVDARGIFHQLFAPGFPAQQDHMVVAVAVEWDEGETGRQEFRIDLLDPSRSPSLTINGHTDVGPREAMSGPPQT